MSNTSEAAALDLLARDGAAARSDPEKTEAALKRALEEAPWSEEVRLGAYRFYFYNHRYTEAIPHADALISHAARQLNLPVDWRDVRPEDARFTAHEFAPGLFLQCLIAWGYCHARLGNNDQAREALGKAAALDPSDRFGAAMVLHHLETRLAEDSE
ncbi:MAG: tetratricopeptide repeat protein [Pseudomonadota bacterium]